MSQFVKTNFCKIHTEDVLRRPVSPGKWVGKPSYLAITRLQVACGGGIGGSTWYEYVQRISLQDLAKSADALVLRTWNGQEIFLNKAYIVKAEQLTIATAVFNSENRNYPLGEYTYCYLTKDGHEFTLSDE